jgi:hypothetical protein
MSAARRAAHCDAALAETTNGVTDIFVYLHGSDWCPVGERIKQRIWDSESFAASFDNSVCLVSVDQTDQLEGHLSADFKNALDSAEKSATASIAHISTKNKSIYKPLADGSWLASKSPNPSTEEYTVGLKRRQIDSNVLILTVMTDDSLPGKGPGRDNGNIVISEIKASVEDGEKQIPIKFTTAWADYAQKYHSAESAIDGVINNSNGWAIDGNLHHSTRRLVLLCDKPIAAGAKVTITIYCKSKWRAHTPGRFGIKLIGDPKLTQAFNKYSELKIMQNHNKSLSCSTDNYPTLICFDAQKRVYARIQPLRYNISAKELADSLNEFQQKRIERDSRWQKAENSSGYRKALLLGKGLELTGGPGGRNGAYRKEFDELKKADPDDKTGYIRKYEFPLGAINKAIEEERKTNGEEAALAMVDSEVKNPKNKLVSSSHIQDLLLTKFNIYRNWKGHEEERYKVLSEIAKLDPDTHQGIGAQGYLMYRGKSPEISLYHDWFPNHIKNHSGVWTIRYGMPKAFPHPGLYRISLTGRGGKNSLKIKSLTLVVGSKRVSTDSHEAIIKNRSNQNNNYYVEWPQDAPKEPATLRIEYEPVDGTDNRGRFYVTPMLPEDLPADCRLLADSIKE